MTTTSRGVVKVTSRAASSFPPDGPVQDIEYPVRDRSLSLRGSEGRRSETMDRTLANTDDGSTIDVLCMYTRQALCQEAVQNDFCDVEKQKHVMDDKCELAISETVRQRHKSGISLSAQDSFLHVTHIILRSCHRFGSEYSIPNKWNQH